MRSGWRIALVIVTMAGVVHAEDAAASLVAEGEAKAVAGEFSKAIELFKRADSLVPSAKHACLIGLAYTRRELWAQAELFLTRCEVRATAADPLPPWFPEAMMQLRRKLEGVDLASVELRVEPADFAAKTTIAVSSFAADETISPRTLRLVPGVYVFTASTPGVESKRETTTVKLGETSVVTFKFPGATTVTPEPSTWGNEKWLLIAAGAVALGGGGFHYWARAERLHLVDAQAANDTGLWDAHHDRFAMTRALAFASYGVAAVAAVTGIVLHVRRDNPREPTAPVVGAAVTPEGAFVGITVHR